MGVQGYTKAQKAANGCLGCVSQVASLVPVDLSEMLRFSQLH